MDVFKVRDMVIDDYRSFTTASIDVKDARLKHHYEQELDADRQWPEPWISLNPAFASGGRIDELVREGFLNPECPLWASMARHPGMPTFDTRAAWNWTQRYSMSSGCQGKTWRMNSFNIVKRKELATHGTYLTKDLILSIYDEMQAAMATGTEYRSPLEQEQP
ncbi:hypothetical protein SAMN02745244_03483 [Tessaracoccus bendigoensis DSM 12906]|uniref:Uncharacterized protein n=1 Tax=Tessaracoccus bendigoensis DSM 12906 TaxID=1123357 RepID=A0A1M6MWS4_9ACTN|nr:hypothetical protein [Tessaracoccus bendigoensis]SHJ87917.1 hypothetical protein SAMN02745244_03483 [Tessaracoccus bendigoensis DSM 12906]